MSKLDAQFFFAVLVVTVHFRLGNLFLVGWKVLSDESIRVSDLEVWVPDASGVLALSTHLLYDDAPWLTKQV